LPSKRSVSGRALLIRQHPFHPQRVCVHPVWRIGACDNDALPDLSFLVAAAVETFGAKNGEAFAAPALARNASAVELFGCHLARIAADEFATVDFERRGLQQD